MSTNFILHSSPKVERQTALSVSETIWSHAYHDANKIFGTYAKAIPLAGIFSIVAAGVVFPEIENPQEKLTASMTLGFSLTSGYLARTVYETRKKLDFMRKSFQESSKSFRDTDIKLTTELNKSLSVQRPKVLDMIDFIKYPVRTSVAYTFAVPAALAASGQSVLLSAGTMFFLMATAIGEEDKTKEISNKASRAREYLKKVKQMQFNGLSLENQLR